MLFYLSLLYILEILYFGMITGRSGNMKKPNINKRDIKFYLLGIATILVLDLTMNWESHKAAFMQGMEDASAEAAKSTEGARL
jgi:hypothetical protein